MSAVQQRIVHKIDRPALVKRLRYSHSGAGLRTGKRVASLYEENSVLAGSKYDELDYDIQILSQPANDLKKFLKTVSRIAFSRLATNIFHCSSGLNRF